MQGISMAKIEKPYPSIRLFKSDFMEYFSHVHPITPLLLWSPIIAYFFYRAFAGTLPAWVIGSWAALGLFAWTLAEYLLHRFIFHLPAQSVAGERFIYILHGLHHADAVDPTRLVLPPFPAVCFSVVLYAIFYALLGAVHVAPFFGGFLVGYLCYDYIHYSVHHFTPRTKIGKMLKQSHMTHHFVSPNARWGVSSPLWDYVFGTLEAAEQIRHGS